MSRLVADTLCNNDCARDRTAPPSELTRDRGLEWTDRLELALERAEEPAVDLEDPEAEAPAPGTLKLVRLATGLSNPTSSCCSPFASSLPLLLLLLLLWLAILSASSCIKSSPTTVTPGKISLSALRRTLGNSTVAALAGRDGRGGKGIEGARVRDWTLGWRGGIGIPLPPLL